MPLRDLARLAGRAAGVPWPAPPGLATHTCHVGSLRSHAPATSLTSVLTRAWLSRGGSSNPAGGHRCHSDAAAAGGASGSTAEDGGGRIPDTTSPTSPNTNAASPSHSSAASASPSPGPGAAAAPRAPPTSPPPAPGPLQLLLLPLPSLSHTMTSGRVAAWRVSEGARVSPYDVVCDVDTESLVEEGYRTGHFAGTVRMLIESQEEGWVAARFASEGEEVAVGAPIALLAERREDLPAAQAAAAALAGRVRNVYDSGQLAAAGKALGGGAEVRVLEWQAYLAEGPPPSAGGGCGCM